MRAWTMGMIAVPMLACAAGANAAERSSGNARTLPHAAWPAPAPFDGSRFDPAPLRRGSFIASVPVAPNATVGFGRFDAMPKRRLGPPDVSLSPPKVRRAAVGLSLRF